MGKFLILAAGVGSRNTFYSNLHKGLLPIENVPAISRIIGNVPQTMDIVIAVGHLKEQLKSYLNFVHPERNITFVDIDPYDGPGSGPGITLLQCKDHLQCPFIFTSVDTLIPKNIEHRVPSFDWIGVDKISAITYACVKEGSLERVSIPPIYIGIAGICDYQSYFRRLEESHSCEVTDGFNNPNLLPFSWNDTGSDASYQLIQTSTLVPPKADQILFIDNGKVVKFFTDEVVANTIYDRSNAFIDATKVNSNMIGYDYIDGELFTDLPETSEHYIYLVLDRVFVPGKHNPVDESLCSSMYEQKTRTRIASLLEKYPHLDSIECINGVKVKPIEFYLNNIPWDHINKTSVLSDKFHGDVQPENIIVNPFGVYFIDWRDSFGGSSLGDMYYDYAKLWHGCLVSNQMILSKRYDIEIEIVDSATLSIDIKPFLKKVLFTMKKYIKNKKLDWDKINLLGSIQYLTIATLYSDEKYASFLFLLGKLLLEQSDNELSEIIELISR